MMNAMRVEKKLAEVIDLNAFRKLKGIVQESFEPTLRTLNTGRSIRFGDEILNNKEKVEFVPIRTLTTAATSRF